MEGFLFLPSLSGRPDSSNMPWFCWCLRLIPEAEVGKAALEKCPKETGHLNSHCLPQPLSGRFQLHTTVQPIRLPACFSTSSRRIREENKGSWETHNTCNLKVPWGPSPLSPAPPLSGLPRLPAERVDRLRVGLRLRPRPGIREVTSLDKLARGTFAHGHALSAKACLRRPSSLL